MPQPFLTAAWHKLVMLNFAVGEQTLLPYLPRGVTLDRWRGDCYVSLVGFMFESTRVLGCRVPGHQSFPEVNLRFYVVREVGGEVRRGVVFVKEIVSRRVVAWIARRAYDENYVACPMWVNYTHSPPANATSAASKTDGLTGAFAHIEYGWRVGGRMNAISATITGDPLPASSGSEAEFITEHYWGYTKRRSGDTAEYRVEHPPWRVWDAKGYRNDIAVADTYGPEFTEALTVPPTSAFVAEGSPVVVYRGTRVIGT